MFVSAGCPYKAGSQKKSVKETCFIDTVTEHLSIEILKSSVKIFLKSGDDDV